MSGTDQLPENPSRDNYSYGCELAEDDDLPDHLDRCECESHTGVCDNCGYKITVGPSGVEYGHARATNRAPDDDGVRRDCTHRPLSCNPGEPHAWDGYDKDEWNAPNKEIVTDGGTEQADTEHTECAVCGYQPDPERVPPHFVLSLSDEDIDDEYVQSYPFGGSLSVPFACSDECWLDAQDDPELVTDGGAEQTGTDHVDRHGRVANHPDEFRADADELEIFDAGLGLGYLRRLEVLLDACPVKIFAASSLKHPWPYRLQNAAECYPASFWRSHDRILDSAIGEDLSNAEVLDHAVERHATAVVAKDYLDDPDATTDSIREFIDLHHPETHPRAYIPLQPPYDDHVAEVYPLVEDSHLEHRYMLGGLATASPNERIEGLLDFRAEVGDGPTAHGLGWGLDDELVAFVRDNPEMLDSVDNSSPSQAVQNDRILDKHWRSKPFAHVDGTYQNTVGGTFEFAMLVQATHRMTEFNDDFENTSQQTTLVPHGGARADD